MVCLARLSQAGSVPQWVHDYMLGASQELYRLHMFPACMTDGSVSFREAAQFIYDYCGVSLGAGRRPGCVCVMGCVCLGVCMCVWGGARGAELNSPRHSSCRTRTSSLHPHPSPTPKTCPPLLLGRPDGAGDSDNA